MKPVKVGIGIGAAFAVAIAAIIVLMATHSQDTPPVKEIDEDPVSQPIQDCAGSASCIAGAVTRIVDGDTLDISGTRVRLALVNTPEIGMEGYMEAKQFTAELCPVGTQAVVDEDDGQTEGSFGRMIGKVTCAGNNLNDHLLRAGLAEVFTDFCSVSEFQHEDWATENGC